MRILVARIYIVNVFRVGGRLAADGETALGDRISVNVSERLNRLRPLYGGRQGR
jgi:hypothetical protein